MYLLSAYDFIGLDIASIKCIAAIRRDDEPLPPATIKTHMTAIEKNLGIPAIYVCRAIKAWNRERMIAQRVQFVVPGNQMYLPALGLDLRDYYLKAIKEEPKNGLTPSAQVVLIALLLRNEQSQAEIAETTGYARMSVSRAIDELVSHRLVKAEFIGKLRIAKLAVKPRAALRAMPSPVRERFFVDRKPDTGVHAGMDALEKRTSISADHETLAVSQAVWKVMRKTVTTVPFGDIEIEVWRYDPAIFAKKGIADRISLYLSLRDDKNERVQMALQEMIEDKHG
jgi:DNA-binding transcriptional ArsR family regulator